ncbi:MAG: NADH:flavin oxidoreductase [Candidatus Kryptoniota bacterium]
MHIKHFTYKGLEEIQADIKKLGLDITFETDFKSIWSPIKIANQVVGNSLAINPMEGCDGTLDGNPDELTYRRWERFGASGAKLIWGEATAVTKEGRANPRQLMICEKNLSNFEELVRRTRVAHRERYGNDSDLLIGLQLTHSGRFSYEKPLIAYHHPGMDLVTYTDKSKKTRIPDSYPVVTDDYLESLQDDFVTAAKNAQRAGFDFVDIKQCHSYLLNELLGARFRKGMFGGDFENRTRFIREVVARISDIAGRNFIIGSRISAYDGVPFVKDPITGYGKPMPYSIPYEYGFGINQNDPLTEDLTEVHDLVKILIKSGVSILSVSLGSPYCNMHLGRPFERPPVDGYYPPEHPLIGVARHFRLVESLQKAFPTLPIVGTGYSWLRQYFINAAESNIRRGRVSIVGIGRGAIAYPEFVYDLLSRGKIDESRVCIGASFCTDLMRSKNNELGQYPTGCVPRDPVYAKIYKETLQADREHHGAATGVKPVRR